MTSYDEVKKIATDLMKDFYGDFTQKEALQTAAKIYIGSCLKTGLFPTNEHLPAYLEGIAISLGVTPNGIGMTVVDHLKEIAQKD